jgi:tetratricopeptide (TPR) repeat protein
MYTRKLILLFVLSIFSLTTFSQNIAQANKLYQQKNYDEAFAIYKTVKSGSPQYAESRYFMGQVSFNKQDYSKAEEYLKQAIESNGNVAKYHVAMKNVYLRLISNASMLKQATLASRLRSHMEEAVRLNPNDMNTSIMLVGFYKQAPSIMGGSNDKANTLATQMTKLSKADGHLAYALIFQMDKDFDKAEKNYKSSISIAPDSVKYYYSLAQFYQSQSMNDKALETFEMAMVKFPDNRNLLLQTGRLYALSEQKDVSKGIGYLNSFINTSEDKTERSLGDAYYYLGLIEKNKNNKQLATNNFNKALNINPDHRWAKEALKELD